MLKVWDICRPGKGLPGMWDKCLKYGTSRIIWDGWQPQLNLFSLVISTARFSDFLRIHVHIITRNCEEDIKLQVVLTRINLRAISMIRRYMNESSDSGQAVSSIKNICLMQASITLNLGCYYSMNCSEKQLCSSYKCILVNVACIIQI